MYGQYLDFYQLTPAQAAQAAHANDDVQQHPGIYLYLTQGESLTGIYYGPDITGGDGDLINVLTGQYEARPAVVSALPEWSANHPDGHSEGYADLAAESGWGACSECGEWQDTTQLVEVDGYYWCPQHRPDIDEVQRAEAQRVLDEYGPTIAVIDDAEYEEDYGDTPDDEPVVIRVNEAAEWFNAEKRLAWNTHPIDCLCPFCTHEAEDPGPLVDEAKPLESEEAEQALRAWEAWQRQYDNRDPDDPQWRGDLIDPTEL